MVNEVEGMSVEVANQLRVVLRRLADNVHCLQSEYWESRFHCVRTSQTGVRVSTARPSSPGDDRIRVYLDEEVEPVLRGWALNLADETGLSGLPSGQPLAQWCAWLSRHRVVLASKSWAQDCLGELVELDAALRAHMYPAEPGEVLLPDFATADEIGRALGKSADAVRKWCARHEVTAYVQGGRTHYRTAEIRG